ncbi:ribosome maturation factor RimM, partial [Staphylococcus aureus]|nr:ribosome maturation factor RimM [Staphylococcus aureus]
MRVEVGQIVNKNVIKGEIKVKSN